MPTTANRWERADERAEPFHPRIPEHLRKRIFDIAATDGIAPAIVTRCLIQLGLHLYDSMAPDERYL